LAVIAGRRRLRISRSGPDVRGTRTSQAGLDVDSVIISAIKLDLTPRDPVRITLENNGSPIVKVVIRIKESHTRAISVNAYGTESSQITRRSIPTIQHAKPTVASHDGVARKAIIADRDDIIRSIDGKVLPNVIDTGKIIDH